MGKFDGILICTDCDGTLTDCNGEISSENVQAIQYFQREGGRFTLATGRFPEYALKFSDQFQVNAPVISLNGVILYDLDAHKAIYDMSMEKEQCIKVLHYLNKRWKGIWEYWFNFSEGTSACYKPLEDKFESETLKIENTVICKEESSKEDRNVFEQMKESMSAKIGKVVFVMPEEMLRPVQKDLRETFGNEFHFDSSWPNGLEMQWAKSSKGIAVQNLRKYLGNIKTTICIGDYDNDISMLKVADIGYAVANAIHEVKEVADRITVSNNESAIAAIMKELKKEI